MSASKRGTSLVELELSAPLALSVRWITQPGCVPRAACNVTSTPLWKANDTPSLAIVPGIASSPLSQYSVWLSRESFTSNCQLLLTPNTAAWQLSATSLPVAWYVPSRSPGSCASCAWPTHPPDETETNKNSNAHTTLSRMRDLLTVGRWSGQIPGFAPELAQDCAESLLAPLVAALRTSAASRPTRLRARNLGRLALRGVVSHSWRRRTFQSARLDMWAAQLPDLAHPCNPNWPRNRLPRRLLPGPCRRG